MSNETVNFDQKRYNDERNRRKAGEHGDGLGAEKQIAMPKVSGREMVNVLSNRFGYRGRGGKGDHVVLENPRLEDGDRFVTVPVAHERLKPGTAHMIVSTVVEQMSRVDPDVTWNSVVQEFH